MNKSAQTLLRWWQARPTRERRLLAAGAGILAVALTISAWAWLREEQARLTGAVARAELQLRQAQDDLAEVQQLQGETRPPQPSAKNLVAPLSNSLRAARIGLSVSPADGERLKIEGSAGFDETIGWLGSVQRDYRLVIVSLVAARDGGMTRFEIVLGAAAS